MKHYNYELIWNKYLPVIRILLKRAATAEQSLKLNANEFEQMGLTRKSGYKFDFHLRGGKLAEVIIDHPLASSLAQALLADPGVRTQIEQRDFWVSLSSRYELLLRCETLTPPVGATDDHV